MSWRSRVGAYIRYNLCVMPIIFCIYVPYNILFIGFTPFQLIKWATTAGLVSLFVNAIIQPWVSFCYHKRWLK